MLDKDSANERNASLLAGYKVSVAYIHKPQFANLLNITIANTITNIDFKNY